MAFYIDSNGINLTSFGGKRLYKNKVAVNISPFKLEIIDDGFDTESNITLNYLNTATQLEIGKNAAGNYLNGTIKSFYYFPESVSSEVLKSISLQPQTDTALPNADSASIVLKIAIPTANTVWNLRNMGFVNATVNWGDNQSQTVFNNINTYNITTVTPHTYTTAGVYYVTITKNTSAGVRFTFVNTEDARRIISIPFIGTQWSWDAFQANYFLDFQGCTNLVNIESFQVSGISALGNATSGNGFFRNCTSLESFPFFDASALVGIAGAWNNCSNLIRFPLINTANVTSFGEQNQGGWEGCSSLTSFPSLNTSNGRIFIKAWNSCSSLTSFPLLDFSAATNITDTWGHCSSLTSFPFIDTSSVTAGLGGVGGGQGTWINCSSLTSFPALSLSGVTGSIAGAWAYCSGLTSFPAFDFPNVTSFGEQNQGAWTGCINLTSFPLINTSAGTSFYNAWLGCYALTSFPLINTAAGQNFTQTWYVCLALTSFPALNFSAGTNFFRAWSTCPVLTTFPPNLFNSCLATNFNQAWISCALTAASIENIIVSINTANTSNGTLGLNGGTNASKTTWTTAANTAYDALIARGWTIAFNA